MHKMVFELCISSFASRRGIAKIHFFHSKYKRMFILYINFFLQAFKCAYVMLIMAAFWVTEALPLAITSLLPVALLPVLGKAVESRIFNACIMDSQFNMIFYFITLFS